MLAISPIEELKKRFNAEAAKNISATYLLQITGEGGGVWLAKIANGALDLQTFDAAAPAPDCTIAARARSRLSDSAAGDR